MNEWDSTLTKLGFGRLIVKWFYTPISRFLYLEKVSDLYEHNEHLDAAKFVDSALSRLNIKYNLINENGPRIPSSGPCIIVSNHPTGLLDGLILIKLISSVRNDFKLAVNFLLKDFDFLTSIFKKEFIYVDPFAKSRDAQTNYKSVKEILKSIANNEIIIFFPAADIAKFSLNKMKIADKEWDQGCLKLIFRSGVSIIPIHICSSNSGLFNTFNYISSKMGLLFIFRELFNKSGSTISIHKGEFLNPNDFRNFADFKCELNKRLRLTSTY